MRQPVRGKSSCRSRPPASCRPASKLRTSAAPVRGFRAKSLRPVCRACPLWAARGTRLSHAGRVVRRRVVTLRTRSNCWSTPLGKPQQDIAPDPTVVIGSGRVVAPGSKSKHCLGQMPTCRRRASTCTPSDSFCAVRSRPWPAPSGGRISTEPRVRYPAGLRTPYRCRRRKWKRTACHSPSCRAIAVAVRWNAAARPRQDLLQQRGGRADHAVSRSRPAGHRVRELERKPAYQQHPDLVPANPTALALLHAGGDGRPAANRVARRAARRFWPRCGGPCGWTWLRAAISSSLTTGPTRRGPAGR